MYAELILAKLALHHKSQKLIAEVGKLLGTAAHVYWCCVFGCLMPWMVQKACFGDTQFDRDIPNKYINREYYDKPNSEHWRSFVWTAVVKKDWKYAWYYIIAVAIVTASVVNYIKEYIDSYVAGDNYNVWTDYNFYIVLVVPILAYFVLLRLLINVSRMHVSKAIVEAVGFFISMFVFSPFTASVVLSITLLTRFCCGKCFRL